MSLMMTFEAAFPRGEWPIYAFGPLEDCSVPVVLVFPDAFGDFRSR
jgi:hypothetical protein